MQMNGFYWRLFWNQVKPMIKPKKLVLLKSSPASPYIINPK